MLSTKKNNMKGLIIKISVIIVLNIVFKSSIYAQDVLSLKKDLNDHYCTACKNRSERHAYYKQKIKNALAENNQKSVAYYLFFQGKNYAEFGKFDSTLYNFKKSLD